MRQGPYGPGRRDLAGRREDWLYWIEAGGTDGGRPAVLALAVRRRWVADGFFKIVAAGPAFFLSAWPAARPHATPGG
jgi:hypothetical protein